MKIDMSPNAIENRLKLVGELTKVCLLVRKDSLEKIKKERETNDFENYFPQPKKSDLSNKKM